MLPALTSWARTGCKLPLKEEQKQTNGLIGGAELVRGTYSTRHFPWGPPISVEVGGIGLTCVGAALLGGTL